MKKLSIFFVFALLAFGLVSAVEMGAKDGTGYMHDEVMATGGQNGSPALYGEMGTRMMLQSGEYLNEKGQTMRIQGQGEQMMLRVGEYSANCSEECNLTQEMVQNRTRIHAQLSHGNMADIKVMPDVAAERAIERLRLNMCENCSIELKEVGQGDSTKMAYEVNTRARAKVFGIFNTNVDAEVQVDAETGEVIRTRKPWWAVLQAE